MKSLIQNNRIFAKLKIAKNDSFNKYLNKCNVILLNMQDFLSEVHGIDNMISLLEKQLLQELLRENPDIDYLDNTSLMAVLKDVYAQTKIPFVFIIDEWDCIFREKKEHEEAQKRYLDFFRKIIKDKVYVKLAYMTGILPIKKYGTHSALNMFDEFSMTEPRQLAEFVGFTEKEVRELCEQYHMDFEETKRWYDGYLGYDNATKEVFIPNAEVYSEFVNAVEGAGWKAVVDVLRASEQVLQAVWKQDEKRLAAGIEQAHMETSILTYNDENALSYTLSLAFYAARVYYNEIEIRQV